MSGFANQVLGGASTLIRRAIRSPNYLTGVSGWTVNKDGSVEFTTGTFRGKLIGSTLLLYSPSIGLNNLVVSESASGGTDNGNAYLAGQVTYGKVGATYYAQQSSGGVLTVYTAASEAGPWTQQASITLADPSNVGGMTLSAPSIRIVASNNSGLEIVNGVNQWQPEELLAYTPTDQPINTQTNLTQDVYLSFSTLQPSATYEVEGRFYFTGPTSTGFKWAYAIGASGDYFIAKHIYVNNASVFTEVNDIYTASGTPVHTGVTDGTSFTTNGHSVLLAGTYITAAAAASPGVFGLMWAQATSNAGNLNLRKGSNLTLRRIA